MSEESLGAFPEFHESIQSISRANEAKAIGEFERYKKDKAAWLEI